MGSHFKFIADKMWDDQQSMHRELSCMSPSKIFLPLAVVLLLQACWVQALYSRTAAWKQMFRGSRPHSRMMHHEGVVSTWTCMTIRILLSTVTSHFCRVGACVHLPRPMCVWYGQCACLTSMRRHSEVIFDGRGWGGGGGLWAINCPPSYMLPPQCEKVSLSHTFVCRRHSCSCSCHLYLLKNIN